MPGLGASLTAWTNNVSNVIVFAGRESHDGHARRPWCPATRVQEHKDAEAIANAADAANTAGGVSWDNPAPVQRRTGFDPLKVRWWLLLLIRSCGIRLLADLACGAQVDDNIRQTNEGKWPFTFSDSADGRQLILTVKCSHHVTAADILVDLHPMLIRMLIKVSPNVQQQRC